MNNVYDYIDVSINIDKNNLYVSENANISIIITNISNLELEHVLFKFIVDEKILNILDDNYKVCINDFGLIGDISPNSYIAINIPIKVVSIPKDLLSNVYCYINFHVVNNNNLIDLNFRSSVLNINLLDSNVLILDDFNFYSSKSSYIIDEDIDLNIILKNNGNYPLNNIKIRDFIPENTHLVENSLSSSKESEVSLIGDNIIVEKLNNNDEITINYKININEKHAISTLNHSIKLNYTDKSTKEINLTSNPVNVNINDSCSVFSINDFTYEIDKSNVFEDELITHTIKLINNTDIDVFNLILISNSKFKFEFVENSLIVNDIYRVGEDINNPILLGELESSDSIIITFKTKASSYGDVNMYFSISYDTLKRSLVQNSNSINYTVLSPRFEEGNFIKSYDKEFYCIGDTCETMIELINTGNSNAKNVILKDSICTNLEFIKNSLSIDNTLVDGDIFSKGINLNDIEPNQKVVVKYKSKVVDVQNSTKSISFISYGIKDNNSNLKVYSNVSEIKILGAKIGNGSIKKELSSYTAQIGDIITANIEIKNTGNIDCKYLKLQDDINSALEFIKGSLIINNKPSDESIFDGLNIDKIMPLETINISYQLKVLDFPRPNPIIDKTTLSYSYIINNELKSNIIYSNKSKFYVNNPHLDIVDRTSAINDNTFYKYCHYEDYIFFNLVVENKGNVGVEDLKLNFDLPKDLVLDLNTLKVNNNLYTKDFEGSIKLPNLNVSQSVYLEFFVKHSFYKNYNLESLFCFEYTFRDLKTRKPFKQSLNFKENIIIIKPDISVTKLISDKDIELGKEFTKNINIKNTGNVFLKEVNLFLNENEFLKNSDASIFVDGEYVDRTDPILIGDLDINETINIAIRYNVDDDLSYESNIYQSSVTACYNLNNSKSPIKIKRNSNKLKLNIKNYNIDVKGRCSLDTLMLNDSSKYNFTLINKGNSKCDLIKLDINIPECLQYISNSLCINSKNMKLKKLINPITIENLNCNESVTVSFDFLVSSIPFKSQTSINGIVYSNYEYEGNIINKVFQSEDTIFNIENLSLEIIKLTSHNFLQTGDILKVQTIVNNTGNIDVSDLVLKDNDEKNLLFIENSLYIDGENIENLNPIKGLNLGSLKSSENILLSYDYEYIPSICSNKVSHFSDVSYSYKLNSSSCKNITQKSDVIYIDCSLSTFKQFNIENEYILNEYEPDIYDVANIFTDVKIDDFYEINSIKNTSYDNFTSTGKKVIIKGSVMDRVEYLIRSDQSSLYMLERTQPFTIFISLPDNWSSNDIHFRATCDDTFYKTTGLRSIFVSSLISIEGIL